MIQKLMNKPLLISPQFMETMSDIEWIPTEKSNALSYTIYDSVAVVSIHGLLTKRQELFSSFFGTTSYDEIFEVLSSVLEDSKVEKILLDIDSPGGEVSGLFDLVDFIYESRSIKPIYSMANDSAFSAAYAIASATEKIFVNRTSGIGSIGVIATHIDISELDKKEGVKYTTIFAGDKKNDLSPHAPLTENAISDLQNEIDRLYEMFVETVSRNRNISSAQIKATQAGIYFGAEAIAHGLADRLEAGHNILKEISDRKLEGKFGMVLNESGTSRGEEMTEEIDSKNGDETNAYKAEVLEIVQLCKLAHAENKIVDFIGQQLSAGQVKEELLGMMDTKTEISSTVYRQEIAQESPVIAAAKKRAAIN